MSATTTVKLFSGGTCVTVHNNVDDVKYGNDGIISFKIRTEKPKGIETVEIHSNLRHEVSEVRLNSGKIIS